MSNLIFFGILAGGVAVFALLVGFILAKMFRRASKEQAFVRTGMGGQRVVKDGGAVILPVFHETIPINMQTLRLTVQRGGVDGSLITKDRLRVDVKAEFYVRVAPDVDSIATAAQTLGRRTLAPAELALLIEGKFVDALRAAAAGMDMQDLHEKRSEFVQKVQNTVAEDLKKNGLELESVSLTGLDQTDVKHFNPNNAFDAEGLAKLTAVTETRRKERNEIEADARVAIETKNLEANSKSLELAQAQEFARLEQEREVETRRAEQESQLASQRAERKREADTAEIEADRATAASRIEAERTNEASRIAAAQTIETARVAKDRSIKVAETEAAQALELSQQNSRIAIAAKTEEESKARAAADIARALQVKAAEAVKTVEAEAQATRAKTVAVIAAEQEAEKDATRIRVMADAELAAADKQAQAKERLIEADAKRYIVESEGQRSLNEAGNVVSERSMAFSLKKALIAAMPTIIEQMAKPMENIDSIRVVQMGGMTGGTSGAEGHDAGQTGNLSTDLTNAMLRYRLQVPVVDELARELGMDMRNGLNGMVEAIVPEAMVQATGTDSGVAPTKRPTAPVKTVERPLPAEEKALLQKMAGIKDE